MFGCNTLTFVESELLHPISIRTEEREAGLLSSFFVLEHVARLHYARRIDRDVSLVNMPDYAFFIDQERGTIAKSLLLVEDAVVSDDGAFEIAEQRKHDSDLFGELAVGGNTVYTQSEDLSFV